MPHARHRSRALSEGTARRVLPALLLSAAAVAFAGLAAVPAPDGDAPTAQVLAFTEQVPTTAPVEPERSLARASRGRRLEERARAEAEAKAKAAADAKAKADAEAAAAAKAEAEAKAAAEAEARATAARELRASRAASLGRSGACPVPSASFVDSWGAPRSGGRAHKGTDMMAAYGAPVYAVSSGTVRTASSGAGGISLYLRADNGETYFYAHNSQNLVSSGERVSAGDLIARVGTSGNAPASAPHVHFERQVGGTSVNPYAFLRRLC